MESDSELSDSLRSEFERLHGNSRGAIVVRSPGRINLIGEHTDYNEGFVLPSAIDRAVYLAVAPRKGFEVTITSLDFNDQYRFDAREPVKAEKAWANYVIGVVSELVRAGHKVGGFDCVYAGNIPIGAGLSSSAAVEAGLALSLDKIHGFGIDRTRLARIAQRAENDFVGVKCGIMDQFANLLSRGDSALYLDCRTLEYDYIPFLGRDLSFVLCDTGVKHSLASSEYNLRRTQCETGVSVIRRHELGVTSLRDVGIEMLEKNRDEIDGTVYRRCRYVIEENARVDAAARLLRNNDYAGFGKLLYLSHAGLRDEYEVSCRELDVLVEGASGIDGVLGARMMGGGFGGCTLNLVENESVPDFKDKIERVYRKETGGRPRMYECILSPGADVVPD